VSKLHRTASILTIERLDAISTRQTPTARLDSSPRSARLWRTTPHSVAARGALIGLFALRHVGLGRHVHATLPGAVDSSQLAELWMEPSDLESRDLFAGPWGLEAAPKSDDVYSFVAEKKGG